MLHNNGSQKYCGVWIIFFFNRYYDVLAGGKYHSVILYF